MNLYYFVKYIPKYFLILQLELTNFILILFTTNKNTIGSYIDLVSYNKMNLTVYSVLSLILSKYSILASSTKAVLHIKYLIKVSYYKIFLQRLYIKL